MGLSDMLFQRFFARVNFPTLTAHQIIPILILLDWLDFSILVLGRILNFHTPMLIFLYIHFYPSSNASN